MEKIWLKSYPPGVPAEINPDAYQSIVEIFHRSCKQYHDQGAFYNLGTTLTYNKLHTLSRDIAAYFQQTLRLKKGDRLAIMMPNLLQYPIVLFAALRAGLTVVNVNPLYTPDELCHQMNDSGAKAIVVVSNFAHTVEEAMPRMNDVEHVIVTDLVDMLPPIKASLIHLILKYVQKKIPAYNFPTAHKFKHMLAKGKDLAFTEPAITNQDIAFLQYTGGTTGVAKGAMLTHRNIIANVQQADAWFKSDISVGTEVVVTALPLYHIFSLMANCLYFMKVGGFNILITNPRDINGMIGELKRFHFTAITGVNTLFNALIKHSKFRTLDFSGLRLTLGGGMAVQEAVAKRWKTITGCTLLEAYGLTETSPCVTINPYTIKDYNGTIGLPVSSTEVTMLDSEGNEVGLENAGELAVKGPQVMRGYWNNPIETAKVFTKDGWLLTGDIAMMNNQGFVKILERKKDMILVSGFNVYPNEVEDVLVRLDGIREAAVVGIHNEVSGEAPKAFIVRDDPNLSKEDIIHYCRQHLTAYKVPKEIEFTDELPKTNVGKILRRALREKA